MQYKYLRTGIRVGGNIAVHALEIPDGFVPNWF